MQFVSAFLGQRAETILVTICVLIALAVAAIVIMRLFGDAGRALGGRSRQQRLGVVDAFDLDRQRQLVIIRRDNVEHLVMIGGPNDLVIEAAFVRQPGAALAVPPREREAPPPQVASAPPAAFPPPRVLPEREPADFDRREPAMAAPAASPPPAPVQRFPFAPRPSRAAPPPLRNREPTVQPAIAPPAPAEQAPPPPPQPAPPPPLAPVSPAPEVVATAASDSGTPSGAAPVLAAPERPPSRLQQRLNAFPRPSRPFPTLRANPGGPLFPVRSAAKTPESAEPAHEPPPPHAEPLAEPPAPPAAPAAATPAALQGQGAGKGRANVLDAFESLEEEMAKLLGRPSGEG